MATDMTIRETAYSHERLAELISTQGRRIDWFATRLGERVRGQAFDPSYATKLINGDKPITDEIAVAAAWILQVPVEWLRVQDLAHAA
jgi:hypothetical protein